MNWSLSNCFPKHQINFLTDIGMVRKGFGQEPLKDVTMERVRVEEFGETRMKIVGESILFLSKFSLEALYNTWV